MVTERIKVFAATISDAKRKLGEINEALASNTKTMSQLDLDGDMMYDPLLHQAQYQRGHFEGTKAELHTLNEIRTFFSENPNAEF